MTLQGVPPRELTEAHLQRLLDGRVSEGKVLDYKQELPGASDGAKKDFLADLSSFANAAGGHIVFGVTEAEGLPTSLDGLEGDIDAAILRMDAMARDGIRPPIPSVEFVRVPLANGRAAIVAAIRRSWNPPHQVVFGKDDRIYTRASAGKQRVDVEELRRIVLQSQEIGERIRQFRAARLGAVMAGETPIQLALGARTIFHVVPLNAFGAGASVNLTPTGERRTGLIRMVGGGSYRHNVDGLLAFSRADGEVGAYAQLFRNGSIECVHYMQRNEYRGKLGFPSVSFEHNLFEQAAGAVATLRAAEAAPPVAMMLSFVGIQGWEMAVAPGLHFRDAYVGFDRDPLLIPDTLLETFDGLDVREVIKPLIEATWNAAGFPGIPDG
ncbi:MAG: helix-turn-helix domain-containing protein [Alphaproteobacteria bacterium]